MNCRAPGLLAWSLLCSAAAATATAAVAGGSEHVVGQKNKSFSVSAVEAKVGDVVRFDVSR